MRDHSDFAAEDLLLSNGVSMLLVYVVVSEEIQYIQV